MIAALLASPIVRLLLVGAIAFGGGYAWGRIDGRAAGRVEQLRDTVKAQEKREKIDENVQDATRYELCISVGGMPDDCAQLRGVEETAKGK